MIIISNRFIVKLEKDKNINNEHLEKTYQIPKYDIENIKGFNYKGFWPIETKVGLKFYLQTRKTSRWQPRWGLNIVTNCLPLRCN